MPSEPDDLAAHDRLAFSGGTQPLTWRLRSGAKEGTVEVAPRLRVNNSFAVRDAVEQGLGVAQLPLVVAHHQLEQRLLVRVLPDWRPPDVPVHALFPSARYLTSKVRAFIDHAVEAF
jgi:DNA-binding transcriptional LysR family regulator